MRTSSPGLQKSLNRKEYASLVLAVSRMRSGSTRRRNSVETASRALSETLAEGSYWRARGSAKRHEEFGRVFDCGGCRIRLGQIQNRQSRRAALVDGEQRAHSERWTNADAKSTLGPSTHYVRCHGDGVNIRGFVRFRLL